MRKYDKVEITQHGKLYKDLHKEIRCFICPECGSDRIYTATYNDNIFKFFDVFEFQERVTSCICRDCECNFELRDNKKLVKTDWKDLIAIVVLANFGLTILFGILYLVTDSNISGYLTLFSSIVVIVGLVVGLIADDI